MRKLRNEELNRPDLERYRSTQKLPIVVVLDNIRSLHNVGSVFRTSDAFLVEEIYLCGITAKPPHKEIRKTALGATEAVKWTYAEDTTEVVEALKKKAYDVYAVEQTEGSTALSDFEPSPKGIALVFGHEVKGVQQSVVDLCDGALEIPQYGTKHSLNVSVSSGIVLWEVFKKMSALKGV